MVLLLPLAVLAWILREPLWHLGHGLWGPADPWANGDFIGNFWCWWRTAVWFQVEQDWTATLGWPEGGEDLGTAFPNRLDAWLVAPWFRPDALMAWWNGMAALHLGLNVLTATLACRAAGARPLPSALGASLLALSPTLLHELAGGRMATFVLWPGFLAVALALWAREGQGRPVLAALSGVALALQAHGYPFHAVGAAVLVATALATSTLPLKRRALLAAVGILPAVLLAGPYAWQLLRMAPELALRPPPAGYTSLPVAGLLAAPTVPERFRILPLVLPALALGLLSRPARPWALASLALLVASMGPTILWAPGHPLGPGPMAWLGGHPVLDRMHHPVRLAPVALVGGGLALALALQDLGRWRGTVPLATVAVAAAGWWVSDDLERVTSWNIPPMPPGVEAARVLGARSSSSEIPGEGAVLDLWGGNHITALSLQPWHRRPVLETAEGRMPPPLARWTPAGIRRLERVEALARGTTDPASVLADLHRVGFTDLLLVDRPTAPEEPIRTRAEQAIRGTCGEPTWSDGQARVFRIPAPQAFPLPPSGATE